MTLLPATVMHEIDKPWQINVIGLICQSVCEDSVYLQDNVGLQDCEAQLNPLI